jgi:hypothetical protein
MSACEICKNNAKPPVLQNVIYHPNGKLIPINLCRKHDHELFKMGQLRFLRSYYDQVGNSYKLENLKKSA